MTRAFIIRPFGVKQGVDFDAVDAKLLQPALSSIGLAGDTTTDIVEQGNIREDMFRLLVCADLVIADISIHNANVFYELGIRHGVRPNATFMLRANLDEYPFDLRTDRYLAYDAHDPGASVGSLARALRATLDSSRIDSPAYQVLPNLKAPDATALLVVPADFRDDVERAARAGERGDLRLLAHEARGFDWGIEGLRLVGRSQFELNSNPGARESFEWLREQKPDDVEANRRLATLYERLGDLTRSNQAIQRVIGSSLCDRDERAAALALHAHNVKMRWRDGLGARQGEDVRIVALRAPALKDAVELYADAYAYDLNAAGNGINALTLMAIHNELARSMPDTWREQFDSDDEAARALDERLERFDRLAGAVHLALAHAGETQENAHAPGSEEAAWIEIVGAHLAFLTGRRPNAVAQRYREALADRPAVILARIQEHLELFAQLEVRSEFAAAALATIAELQSLQPSFVAAADAPTRVILFTGHALDAPASPAPRFPPTQAAESRAREMIRGAIAGEQALGGSAIVGVAGGACGGDILFHEVCAELGVPTRLFVPWSRERSCAESVQQGGPDWVERYYQLCNRLQPRILMDANEMPKWLRGKREYSGAQRANLWMLYNALALHPRELTMIALWDTQDGDGPGGPDDLVEQVRARGFKLVRLPAEVLKTLA